jgi:signal transduction histidine kinase
VNLGASDLLVQTVVLALVVFGAVVVYRAMQRPRLSLSELSDGTLGVRPRDVALYAVSIPFLVILWSQFLIIVLALAATNLEAADVILIAGSIILATRLLAHIWFEPAHELGKAVPLTLVTLILLGTATRDDPSFERFIDDMAGVELSPQFILIMLLVDYAVTATWYFLGVRWGRQRGWPVPGTSRRRSGVVDLTAPGNPEA